MSGRLLNFVSFEMFKHFALENGVPGAEELTTDFLVFNGFVAGGAINGAITNPADVKLNNEYDYYMTEIRCSGNFLEGAAAAAIGAQPYIPVAEAQHLAFQLTADGRTRPLFKLPVPFKTIIGSGEIVPFNMAAPPAFSGSEKVSCVVTHNGVYNPQAIAAQLDFTIVCTVAIIKAGAIKAYEAFLKAQR